MKIRIIAWLAAGLLAANVVSAAFPPPPKLDEQQVVNALTNGVFENYQLVKERSADANHKNAGKLLMEYRGYITAPRPYPATLDEIKPVILSFVPSAAVAPVTADLASFDAARTAVDAALASLKTGTNGYADAKSILLGVTYNGSKGDAMLSRLKALASSTGEFDYDPFGAAIAAREHKLYHNADSIMDYLVSTVVMNKTLWYPKYGTIIECAKDAGLNEKAWTFAKDRMDEMLADSRSPARAAYFQVLSQSISLTNINGHARYLYEGIANKLGTPLVLANNEKAIIARAKQMEIAARRAANLPVIGPGNLPKTEAAVAAYTSGSNLVTAPAALGLVMPADYDDRVAEAEELAATILSTGREAKTGELTFLQFFLGAVKYKTWVDAYNK